MSVSLKKILEHPDKDEIISKLIIGVPEKNIHEYLKGKYTNVKESRFILSDKLIINFKKNYLDLYTQIKDDILKSKEAVATSTEDQLILSIKSNPTYKNKMMELVNKELDVKQMITNLCVAIESRLAQVFDAIQDDPKNINTRIDRLLIEYANTLGVILEKYYKFTEGPQTHTIQHNVTLQVVDQHISVFHDVIKEILSKMDLETSLYFMEVFNEKMGKLKNPSNNINPLNGALNTDEKYAEAKLLSEAINQKLNS